MPVLSNTTVDILPVLSNIFVRHIYVFREFVPISYFDTKYYIIEKFIYSTSDIPELLFALPFDNLAKEGSSYKTTAISYDTTQKSYKVDLAPVDNYDLYPPKVFKRINLLDTPNVKYASKDLYKTTQLIVGANQMYVYDDEQPYECNRGYFHRLDDSKLCDIHCPSGFSMSPGVSNDKGVCNYHCPNGVDCKTEKSSLTQLKSQYSCEAGFFRMFYTCHADSQKEELVFFYSQYYRPGRIILDYTSYNLYSYFIEFWYNQNGNTLTNSYIFYSNAVQINTDGGGNYIGLSAFSEKKELTSISRTKWNRIIIDVYYDELLISQ